MRSKLLHRIKFIVLSLLVLLGVPASAQICTTHPVTNNANNTVLFNVQNTNATDILVTDVSAMINTGAAGTYSFELLYNPAAISSTGATWTQGVVGAGQNGWVSGGTGSVLLPLHTAPQTVLSGLSVLVPAGSTYGFALTLTSTSTGLLMDYAALTAGAGVNTFSSGGVNILTGDNISWGAAVLPTTPLNYPRGFRGCIGWMSAVPCSGSPTGGTAVGPSAVCPATSFTLSNSGGTTGLGITYQWESSPAGAGTWTPLAGATNSTYTVTGGIAVATDYHVVVTCSNGGGTATSTIAAVAMNPFYSCYCVPTYINGGGGDNITNVQFGSLNNNTSAAGNVLPYYHDYSSQQPGTIAIPDLVQGQAYPMTLSFGTDPNQYNGVWIDYNQNGIFDAAEYATGTPANAGANGTSSLIINIPLTAVPGNTRMRIRGGDDSPLSSGQACGATLSSYGEAEDYLVNIVATVPCAGTPSAGTVSGPAGVCANSSFYLFTTGATAATGISFQWESSPAGAGTWTPMAGATDPYYTVTGGITAATDYHLVVVCANGGGTATSNTLAVGMNPFYNCYCSPLTGVTLYQYYTTNFLTNVTIPGTTLNSTTTTGSPDSYTQLDPAIAGNTGQLVPGLTYTLNTTLLYSGDAVGAWIDFDQSGTYDASEFINFTPGTTSAGFAVPLTATSGLTGLRVRANDWITYYTGADACMLSPYSETEDYIIDIAVLTPCSGTPSAGTASGPAGVCSASDFTLSATGFTIGSGLSYQWESSPAGAGTWTPMAGASTPSYTVTGGQTVSTDYQLVVTCSNGGGTATSNTVAVGMNPFYNCYCSPLTGVTLYQYYTDNFITNVNIPTTTLNSTTTTGSPNSYTQLDPAIAGNTGQLVPGLTYTLNASLLYSGDALGAWIDFDQSGTYDASEFIEFTPGTTSASFAVPLSATSGLTGLRVRANDWITYYSDVDACMLSEYSETEDYIIDIAVLTPCSGTPSAGTASGPAGVCSGSNFTLSSTGFTIGSGLTYQWESSPAGAGTWTPMAGATTPSYTVTGGQTVATDYQLVITCSNGGGTATSNTVAVGMNLFYNCYCSPLTGVTLYQYYTTNFITNVSIPGTTLNSTTTSGSPDSYTQLDPAIASNTAQLIPGLSYVLNVSLLYSGDAAGAWIDFDQSGTYDASEYISFVGTSAAFTVPVTAASGLTGLRVRANDWITYYTGADACMLSEYSETEDYVIDIAVLTACSGTPSAGTASGPAGACANTSFSVNSTGFTIGSGIGYQWESSAAGAGVWTPVTGATDPSYTVSAGITTATDYHLVVTCSNGGGTSTSNTVAVGVNAPNTCYCTPTYSQGTGSGDYISLVQLGNINNATAGAGSPYYTYYSGMTTDLAQAMPYTITLSPGTYTFNDLAVWIDYNQNGVFDATEKLGEADQQGPGATVTFNFTVPAGAVLGTTRMRVVEADQGTTNGMLPCNAYGYGETEDYNVNIIVPPSCVPPSGLSATNITASTADLGWSSVAGAAGYEWAVDQTNTAAPGGASTITATTGTTASASGLSASGTYYLHVRTDCGGGSFSSWAFISFATPPPNDACANAINIGNGIGMPGTTVGATQTMPSGTCAATTVVANDVWYYFTTSATGTVTVTATNTVGDVVLEVLSGSCGAFTQLDCEDIPAIGTETSVLNSLPAGTYYVRVYGYLSSQNPFTVQVTGTPLSIELMGISATNAGNRNRVDWTTGAEQKGDQFEVERSADGINYTRLGTVSAKGGAFTYSYWDNAPVNGVNHYRLRMVEASGKFAYSPVVDATVKNGTFQVLAFPNPVTDELTVQVYGAIGGNAMISISDVTGKTVKMIEVSNGTVKVNMNGMAQGMYLVKYSDDNHSQTIKVNKQ